MSHENHVPNEMQADEGTRKVFDLNIGFGTNLDERLAQMAIRGERIPTGIKELDEHLQGGIPVGVSIFAAKPGIGKTTLALQMAEHMSQAGNQTIYFCNDMPLEELIAKGISRNSYGISRDKGYTVNDVMSHHANGLKDHPVFIEACRKYKQNTANLRLVDSSGSMRIEEIRMVLASYVLNETIRPIVIIDYLQKVGVGSMLTSSDKERLDYLIETLKQISLEFQLPIVVISTINRGSYEKPISFESLKESGGLEYNADLIIGMQHAGVGKEDEFRLEDAKKGSIWKMELVILKQRLGNSDKSILLDFKPKFNLFPYDDLTPSF